MLTRNYKNISSFGDTKRSRILVLSSILLCLIFIIFLLSADIILKVMYPIKYISIIEKYSNEMNVNKYLICSIIKAESNFDKFSVSKSRAKGLMQLMDETAFECAKKIKVKLDKSDDLFDPEINIMLGTYYIGELSKKYNHNIPLALAAYNAGMGNVDRWFENLDNSITVETVVKKSKFIQTKIYVLKVAKNIKIYENLYSKK